MKVHLSTLGCKLNESELEAWARKFANDGYEIVDDAKNADIIVLNTCTVTHVAARKSRQMSRQLARANPNARIVLTGCYVSVSPDEAKALPNVALVVPNADKDRLVEIANRRVAWQMADSVSPNAIGDTPYAINQYWMDADVETQVAGRKLQAAESGRRSVVGGRRTRAFVKIEDGCNMSCTYCIIPIARGKERSRPIADVVTEVKSLVDAGYKEIILTGVQISSYRVSGANWKFALHDLVAAILSETNVPRLRLTSIAPWDLDESLLNLFSDSRLCRHLHLSLQSGSDTVLRRMRRPYSTAQFERAMNISREKIYDVGITTDVIVGFPGESNVEFEQSLEFVARMQFSRVHVFPYSVRSGTDAAKLPLHVSDAVKESRVKQMQAVADASMKAFAAKFIGRELQVLWETVDSQSDFYPPTTDHRPQWSGYTDNYIRVVAPSDESLENVITSARLINSIDDGAVGEVIRKSS
ncbi:MAG: tRNA (N(6)-L-threonylcarbamoyladenosine(37)-C(2))-methylthiotransferase MtaB [Chloroflexi bacterium]|nr:tRNA (N(6)-L-threonylcarbamoyladenosine(37)-C(2))-methylthiotransferase MtaB [Chloroflexota bacterium]